MTTPLVRFQGVTISRLGQPVLRELSWELRGHECWAIVGATGSGKSTFGEAVLGRHLASGGERSWLGVSPEEIRMVSFKEESRLFSYGKHYYQERFNFTDPLDDLTLGDFLRAGTSEPEPLERVADRFGIGGLLGQSFLTLSNGQVRRARLAKAMLSDARILILDEPLMGVDANGRTEIAIQIGEIVAAGRTVIVLTRPDTIPMCVTQVLELADGAIRWQGPRNEYHPPQEIAEPERNTTGWQRTTAGDPIVSLHDVTVRYGDQKILDRVSWTVREGERWALIGPNGAGKSTLLSLIYGDHPQAYANHVELFGRRRGSGESIWEVKRRIGFLSPEFHLYFSEPLTAFRAAATGFHDALTPQPLIAEQRTRIGELFAAFHLSDIADRPLARLSAGQQRLVLLVRALVKQPPLLILDEPFQGLDSHTIRHTRDWLDANIAPTQTLIFVSHHAGEIPWTVGPSLRLEAGRVV